MGVCQTRPAMYQLEVKRYLVEYRFRPTDGWEVTIDLDAMERGQRADSPPDKQERACRAEDWLRTAGARIGTHPEFGRADLVATKPGAATVIVEVEGDSSHQKEQALYSALGQIVVQMRPEGEIRYGLAVPDTPSWKDQMAKIPAHVRDRLSLTLWLVGETGVRKLNCSR